jgi:hypothetical protein
MSLTKLLTNLKHLQGVCISIDPNVKVSSIGKNGDTKPSHVFVLTTERIIQLHVERARQDSTVNTIRMRPCLEHDGGNLGPQVQGRKSTQGNK